MSLPNCQECLQTKNAAARAEQVSLLCKNFPVFYYIPCLECEYKGIANGVVRDAGTLCQGGLYFHNIILFHDTRSNVILVDTESHENHKFWTACIQLSCGTEFLPTSDNEMWSVRMEIYWRLLAKCVSPPKFARNWHRTPSTAHTPSFRIGWEV